MPAISTSSLILAENMRVTRSMSKLAAQGCGMLLSLLIYSSFAKTIRTAAAVIIRRPLFDRAASANPDARLSAQRETPLARHPTSKRTISVPPSYKTGFGFTLGGAPRTPEEREHLRQERLAFFRRGGAYRRKNLPNIGLLSASIATSRTQYTREYVGQRTNFHRVIPDPALLAPPATNYGGQILTPDMFSLVPEIREHAPLEWDEWRPTRRPEYDQVVDAFLLFVPSTSSFGDLSPEDLKRYFPHEWRKSCTSHNDGDVHTGKKRLSKKRGGSRRRHRL
ncbi:hypothetical protein BJV78DRAFT_1284194 [Lactifluus subvellereus]|nr:hypothetical protein BJV78DRAFT_1284194 [Lactifluus subvellereus]